MNPLFEAALQVQDFCRQREWRFCFIGALAVQRWGEPRLTLDVDLTVLTGFGREAEFASKFLSQFAGRIAGAQEFALRNRVLLLEAGGIPVDVALGALPFEERLVQRASPYPVAEGSTLLTCGAEDLVVLKVFAGREKDWLDVEGIVVRQGDRLDRGMIRRELDPLLDLSKDAGARARLARLFEEVPGSLSR